MEIIIVIPVFFFGYFWGKAKVRQEFIQMLKDSEVKIEITKNGSVLYVHEADTGSFILQGNSMEDVIEKLKKHDSTKTFIARASVIKELTESDSIKVS